MKNRPLKHRLKFAFRGILWGYRTERSFRTQVLMAVGALGVLFWFRAQPMWWALFTLVIGAVLSAELINTAIEHVADRLHPETHPVIGAAKDCAAGAVLVLSFAALGVLAAFLYGVWGRF